MRRAISIVVLAGACGCAVGSSGIGGGENPPADAGVDVGAPSLYDGGGRDAAADAGPPDAFAVSPRDAAPEIAPDAEARPTPFFDAGPARGAQAGGPTGLDPKLSVPAPFGRPCETLGNVAECPYGESCRIASPLGGFCEGCTRCRGLGSPCGVSLDCAAEFQCYAGKCTNICMLETTYCGPRSACIPVGNPHYGVCR